MLVIPKGFVTYTYHHQYNYHTKMKLTRYFFLISIFFVLFQSTTFAQYPLSQHIEKSVVKDKAMVVAPHPLASQVGLDILLKGGNAIDAAVAVQFAMAVVFPRAGNIGGGGLMVIRKSDGKLDALDYREKAPAKAGRDMYLDAKGNVLSGLSTEGHLASGVPGTIAGMIAAHKKYGKLKFKALI